MSWNCVGFCIWCCFTAVNMFTCIFSFATYSLWGGQGGFYSFHPSELDTEAWRVKGLVQSHPTSKWQNCYQKQGLPHVSPWSVSFIQWLLLLQSHWPTGVSYSFLGRLHLPPGWDHLSPSGHIHIFLLSSQQTRIIARFTEEIISLVKGHTTWIPCYKIFQQIRHPALALPCSENLLIIVLLYSRP